MLMYTDKSSNPREHKNYKDISIKEHLERLSYETSKSALALKILDLLEVFGDDLKNKLVKFIDNENVAREYCLH